MFYSNKNTFRNIVFFPCAIGFRHYIVKNNCVLNNHLDTEFPLQMEFLLPLTEQCQLPLFKMIPLEKSRK